MIEIPVTYLCWGCGSQTTVYEDTDLLIPSKEVWNVCSNCLEKKDKVEGHDND